MIRKERKKVLRASLEVPSYFAHWDTSSYLPALYSSLYLFIPPEFSATAL